METIKTYTTSISLILRGYNIYLGIIAKNFPKKETPNAKN